MAVVGLGTDICQISRIEKLLEKNGDSFLKRLLTENEIQNAKTLSPAFVAKRYAAKEAVAKALGTGIGDKLSFQDFEIIREGNERPTVLMQNETFKKFSFHLSISDEKEYAVAMVVVENI